MSSGQNKVAVASTVRRRGDTSLYKLALEEYAQAVPPGLSNDDGSIFSGWSNTSSTTTTTTTATGAQQLPAAPSAVRSSRSNVQQQRQPNDDQSHNNDNSNPNQDSLFDHHNHNHRRTTQHSHPFRLDMPDATYEEIYGEAYTGGTIKYMYPSGYQGMRPRSGPWKLSIAIFLLFTWLSIYIVVHCSDQVEYNEAVAIDDDSLKIEVRWCGSRPLYLMWVASMLITGLSAAYCSVIGYIKVRDFAVANSRSQPPGVLDGKSDYYVSNENNIYQADGEPQFWGSQIYRPTQAAVAVTCR
jgi:hypothetical protein